MDLDQPCGLEHPLGPFRCRPRSDDALLDSRLSKSGLSNCSRWRRRSYKLELCRRAGNDSGVPPRHQDRRPSSTIGAKRRWTMWSRDISIVAEVVEHDSLWVAYVMSAA